MGEGKKRATTSIGGENERIGSQTHDVNLSASQDCNGSTGEVGEGASREEIKLLDDTYKTLS
jgi:hypothetical protein